MEMPPWHVGHVIRKVMEAQRPEVKRTPLAKKAGLRPMTITHLLKTGRSEGDTIDKVCDVLNISPAAVLAEAERANTRSNVIPLTLSTIAEQQRRRASDRDLDDQEAEQFARRVLRLAVSAQTVIYNAIRAFEEAYGLLKPRNDL